MKIAFLNISQGRVERGSETFIKELSERLGKSHAVEVISGRLELSQRWPLLWRFYIDPNGFKVAIFTLKNIFKIFKEKYDVVVPLNGGWQPAFIRLATWLYGGKVVISGQSGKGWDDRNNLWSFPDAFVSLSLSLKRWAKRVNPFVRVETIPNGVDIKKFSTKITPLKLDLPRPIILCVGALDKNKRHDLAIKAVANLTQGSLLMVGRGEEERRLRQLGENLLKNRFAIRSFSHKDMPKVYASVDLFTYPTVPWESFGIVLVEAMASGLPVVATDDPIRKEIIEDAGLLVDPNDTEAYAAVLKRALSINWENKPRRQAEKFDWDKIVKRYEKLFDNLVKENESK